MKTKTKPVTSKRQELLIHIIQRNKDGSMKDETLCGKLWDHPVVTSKEICPECEEIAERDGHKWRA